MMNQVQGRSAPANVVRRTGGIDDEIVVDWNTVQRVDSNQARGTMTRSTQQANDLLGKFNFPPDKSFNFPPSQPPVEPEREYIKDVSGKL